MPVSRAVQVGSNLDESTDSNNGGIGKSILRASEMDRQRSRSNRLLAAKPSSQKGEKGSSPALESIERKGRALSHDSRICKEKANAKILHPPTYQPW